MIIMSDAGSSTVATNLNITLDDDAASRLPDGTGIASGTFKPSNYGTVQDPFPAPAPAGPYLTPQTGGTDTLTSAFTGAAGGNPNGTWSLYVVDDASVDVGNINGGWSITLTTLTPVCSSPPTPTPTPSPTPSPTPPPTPTPTATPVLTPTATPCSFTENFDRVVPPDFPADWIATNATGPTPLWVTSTTSPDTSPSDAFIDDPSIVSDKRLDSPSILITSPTSQITFRHAYALEGGGADYYDGGVLEVSSPNINSGNFTDITNAAVGGSFVTGGYNGIISTAFSNPIAGRPAWSQTSSGFPAYITTVANLGPNLVGQTIKIRFRMCSDVSVAATGWRVDTISITGVACTPCGGTWSVEASRPLSDSTLRASSRHRRHVCLFRWRICFRTHQFVLSL